VAKKSDATHTKSRTQQGRIKEHLNPCFSKFMNLEHHMSARPQPIIEEPQVSPQEALASLQQQEKELVQEWHEIHEQALTTLAKRDENERKCRALEHKVTAQGPETQEKQLPQKCKKSKPISPQIKALITHQIVEVGESHRAVPGLKELCLADCQGSSGQGQSEPGQCPQ
jgi:hypothetical protein